MTLSPISLLPAQWLPPLWCGAVDISCAASLQPSLLPLAFLDFELQRDQKYAGGLVGGQPHFPHEVFCPCRSPWPAAPLHALLWRGRWASGVCRPRGSVREYWCSYPVSSYSLCSFPLDSDDVDRRWPSGARRAGLRSSMATMRWERIDDATHAILRNLD